MRRLKEFAAPSIGCIAISLLLGCGIARSEAADVTGAADLGTLQRITIETGLADGKECVLLGSESRQQLIVTGVYSSGRARDLTRSVAYQVSPAGVVQVDDAGSVTPLGDGTATVTVSSDLGTTASTQIKVESFGEPIPINFANQVVPIFTKLGCNSGGCHGKASGQNGFRLSLLGFYPDDDYEFLVKESRGRRLFPGAPDQSLLLAKATNRTPHGGGARLSPDSYEYRLLRRWVAQGMPYGNATDPTVARIEVFPGERVMPRRGSQQVTVIAHYTDGSTEDVTRMTQFEANDTDMAEASTTGLVETLDLTGGVAIMARYQGQVDTFRASIPLGVDVATAPQPRNFIDELVFKKLAGLGVPPSTVSDDGTFIRRASVDITGRLPTADETRQFLADADPAKRDKWIDRLLASGNYADHFASKWSAILRNKRRQPVDSRGTYAFHAWIRESLYANLPYDQFVRQIVAASGELGVNPPVVWYREVKTNDQQVEDTAQLFLGLRIQCARCHHHPFEKWGQDDYYGFAAFFSQVGIKNGLQTNEPRVYHKRGEALAANPRTGVQMKPTGLGAPPVALSQDADPRHALVDWMSDRENPFFARALVNRYWKHFFGRGIVDPEDDMRVTNPPSNPELLDALAQHFVASGFDLKDLVRTICQSQTYQLSSEPNEYNLTDKQNFSRYYPKRLTAEVLLDALDQVTETSTSFNGMPAGTLAVQLPDQSTNNYFLTVFGKPQSDTACECERSSEANLAQSLHLLNSSEIQGKLQNGRAAALAKQDRPHDERVRELYHWVYSRDPLSDELGIAVAHIQKTASAQQAYEDILWALVNTKEFLFNH